MVDVTASGTTQGGATEIPNATGWTVAVIATTSTDKAVKLPADAEIGDFVECHCLDGGNNPAFLFTSSGSENINGHPSTAYTAIRNGGRLFRKLSTSLWVYLGPDE